MTHKLITIEKEYVLDKLYSLIQLCQKTDIAFVEQPFGGRILSAQKLYDRTKEEYGFNDHFDLSEVMREANKLWKIMGKIKNGGEVDMATLNIELEEYLSKGQKINAIRHYRTVMKEKLGEQLLIRECKEYVDSL